MVKRSKKETAEIVRLCAKAIWFTPKPRGPEPVEQVTMAEARRRAKVLVRHYLDKPVTADG